ncbi:MAG: site-2 protease family protein [Butyricicoccus sp.]
MSRIQVRDGFLVLMAALWCADESGVLPIFLLAAAVHECGHLFVIRLSGGTVHALCLTACGAVLRCSLPPSPFSRAAICLAGPAASFALTALANPLGAYRLAGASALLGLFNLLPIPPLDGGMALRHLADGRFTRLLNGIAGVSVLVLLAGGVLLWKSGFGGWLFLAGLMVTVCNPHARVTVERTYCPTRSIFAVREHTSPLNNRCMKPLRVPPSIPQPL